MKNANVAATGRTVHVLTTIAVLLGIAIFLLSIGLFAYAGMNARYWADDYCYSAWVQEMGLIGGIADWYHTSGNRLSTLVAVAASEVFGARAILYVPLAVLALWIAVWVFFLSRLTHRLGWNRSWLWLVWLALAAVYFTALLAPSRLQTLYWRMGTFHYTLPLPLLLLNLGLLAGSLWKPNAMKKGSAVLLALASALLAFFAAGLSETFAALQAGLFALGILASLTIDRGEKGRKSAWLLAAPLAGTLLMMAIMASAPANAWRQAVMPPPENILDVLVYAFRYSFDFVFYTIRGRSLPYLVFWLLMGCAGLLIVPRSGQYQPGKLLAGAALTLVVTIVLIACSFAPSAFAGLQYPAERAQMPAAFVLLAGLGLTAFLSMTAGRAWLAEKHQGGLRLAALILLVILSLYPLRAMAVPRQDLAELSIRAARWDARNAQIEEALRAGTGAIYVRQTDVVQGLEDIGPNSSHWINVCAALYYGADSITAEP